MTSLRILVLTPVLLALMCGGHWGTVSSVLAQEPTKDSAEPQSATVPPSADPSPPSAEERGLLEEEEQDAEKKAPPPPPPWVLQPYVVEVILNFETNSRLPLTTQQRLVQEVQGQLQRRFRQMWQATIRFGEGATSFSRAEVEVLDNDTGLAHFGESAADKVFVVSVNAEPGWFALICREWDSALQLMGPALRDRVMDRRGLGDAIADSICDAFRPIAELEVLEEGKMEFLIRAGEYPPLDPEQTLFRPGDYLMPVMRYLNRSREVRSIQPIPWTYLQVETVDRRRMQVGMTSVFRAPIPASRRRVQVMAMRIRPEFPETRVRIYPRGEPLNPLVGFRCELMNRIPTDEDKVEDRIKMSTNRSGFVTVAADGEHPLQHLYVYSGQALLARVPIMPGMVPEVEIEVPDDTARLNVEGEVALLQGKLIDIVATREVIMARIRAAASKNSWENVDNFLKELDDLMTRDQFVAEIDTLQVQAVYHAQQARDRVAESRIKKLCTGIKESAQKYLDPFRVTDFKREIATMRPN